MAAEESRKNNVPVEFVLTENVTNAEQLYVNGHGLSLDWSGTAVVAQVTTVVELLYH
ncbi:MAG: hypothetical protein WBX01_15025 [Nitrososphaeraceae archaeon]